MCERRAKHFVKTELCAVQPSAEVVREVLRTQQNDMYIYNKKYANILNNSL